MLVYSGFDIGREKMDTRREINTHRSVFKYDYSTVWSRKPLPKNFLTYYNPRVVVPPVAKQKETHISVKEFVLHLDPHRFLQIKFT